MHTHIHDIKREARVHPSQTLGVHEIGCNDRKADKQPGCWCHMNDRTPARLKTPPLLK